MRKSAAVGGLRGAGGSKGRGMPLGRVFKVFALSAALTLAYASAAFADTVTNLLDNTPGSPQFEEVRINEGETRSVPFRVLPNSEKYPPEEDGEDGCNVDAGEVLELGFNTTNANVAREDPQGSRIVFQDGPDSGTTACGPDPNLSTNPPAAAPDDRSITVRGVSRGTANITIAQPPVRNTTGRGSYVYGPATFRMIVQNVAPTANNNSYGTNEDNVLTVNAPGVLGNDTDPGNNPLAAVLVDPPRNGTLRLNADGSFAYTPDENFNGTDTFTYRASDGQAESKTATVSINVAAVNDRPDAAPDTTATGEDRPAVVNVLDNDADADGDNLTVTSTTQPANGRVNCTAVGVCTYVPSLNFNGADSFTYTVSDGKGGTATETVTVSVGAANDAPNAVGNDYTVAEDGTLNVAAPGVLGNDTDPENDALTARPDRGPGNGTLNLNPDGSFTYTPNADYNGPDSFAYRACDSGTPQLCSEPATVEITVSPVNDPPVARGTTAVVDEDGRVEVNVVANDSDADGDPLTVTGFAQPRSGTVDCTRQGVCTYTPNANFSGQDSFTYTVSDGKGGTGTATINVTVRPVNDAPTAQNDSYSAAEDQPLRVDAPGVLGNDSDLENNRLRAFLESGPSNGTLTLSPDGSFVYTPNADFSGQDSFTYRANDDLDYSNVATVTIDVAETNDPPRARDDAAATDEDGSATVNVRGNDSPGPAGEGGQTLTTEAITTQSQNGTAKIDADGTITYTPNANFNGADSFVYRVCDDGEPRGCDTATVRVTVNPVNDPPRAEDDAATTGEDTPVVVNVGGNDSPGPANELEQNPTITDVTDPANGTAQIIREGADAGQVRYTPDPNYSGPDSFEYRVCDGGDPRQCDTATVNVTVGAQNDPPNAEDDRRTVDEDGTLDFPASDLTANDSPGPADEGGQTLTVARVSDPQNGTVRLENGRVVFVPAPDYNGPAGFTYAVCDDGEPRECSMAAVNVDVGAANDAPVARADEASVPEDGSVGVDVLANDTDADGKGDLAPASVRVVEGPSNGTATVDQQTGEITYTPNADFGGADSFTYEVCDDQGACARARVGVTVGAANDPPVARDDRGSTGAAAVVANSYVSQYASSSASSPTRLYRPDTTQRPFTFGRIGRDIPRPLNAIGYRSTDRSLYGYQIMGSPGIVRVNPSTGAARFLGNPPGLPAASNYIAGDVSPNGSTYYLYANKSGVLRVINLSTFRVGSVRLSSRINVADLAVSPVNGRLYGVDRSGRLLEIDPRTGTVASKGVPSLGPGGYGAAWFTAAGDLIAYENGAATRAGGTLYQIKNPTSAPTVASREPGPYTVGNDGAAFVAPPNPAGLSVPVNVLANDADPDGALDRSTVRVVRQPTRGTARVNPDGSITYTSNASYRGNDSFRYEVCDDGPERRCAAATVSITAAPIPAAGVSSVSGSSARGE